MGGGLLQLVAYGAQDVYLTGQPEMTFFRQMYKQHTNFAMECIEQTIDGTPVANGKSVVTIARRGDLVKEIYLELDGFYIHDTTTPTPVVPDMIPWLAEAAVADVELTIGGQRIDKHYSRWWRIFSEMRFDNAKKAGYSKLTTCDQSSLVQTLVNNKLYLPLTFFFNRNSDLALPLIALPYQETKLEFTWTSLMNGSPGSTGAGIVSNPKCFCNYIFLDTQERELFASKPLEYLIEQVQHTGPEAVNAGSNNIRLNFNHPVKELMWWFPNSTDPEVSDYQNPTTVDDLLFVNSTETSTVQTDSTQPHLSNGVVRLDSGVSIGETADGPMKSFYLQMNGSERFKKQDAKYFNQLQPSQYHSGCPMPGMYSYSFALNPEDSNPSGTCNFSRVDTATATIEMNSISSANNKIYMFAHGYNILRVQNGTAGLAYSN